MTNARHREPLSHIAAHARPVDVACLTPSRETALPPMRHLLPELLQGLGVERHAIVPIMALQHRTEPGSLLRDGLLPAPPQLGFDFGELSAHALRHRPPHDLKLALTGL